MTGREGQKNEDRLTTLLKQAMPPARDLDLERDLWPRMAARLDAGPARVPWFDWVLAAAAILALLLFPETLFPLLYHF
ncbi:MAG: hypothetical protein ACRD09_09270 [Vicinamibacterales bacterium]